MTATIDTVETPIYTIARCLNEIIVNDNLDEALQNVAEWLSDFLQINCCYICCDENSSLNKTIFSRNAVDLVEHKNINTKLYPEVHSIISDNRCYKVSINNRVSPELRNWLRASKLQSLLLIPVFRSNKFWGSIGFGDTNNTRTWYSSEIQLQSLAAAIGSAIQANHLKHEIERNNQVYSTALSALNEIVWEIDLITSITKAAGSPNLIDGLQIGSGDKDLVRWVHSFLHEEDKERVFAKFERFLTDRNSYADDDVCRVFNKKTGRYFWMHSRYKVIRNVFGKAISIAGTSIDISDTKDVGFELSKQREQYEFLVQSVGQVVFTLDAVGNCSYVSPAWKNLLGYKPEQSISRAFIQYVSDDNVHIFWEELYSLLSGTKNSFDRQLKLVDATGEKIWVRIMAKTTLGFNNKVEGFFGTIENIDNKYNADLLLQESNDRINAILNSSKEIILTINLENNIIEHVNEAISILGYQPAEWIGSINKFLNGEQRHKFHELMKLAVKSELQVQNQQISFPNKSNTEYIPFEFSTSIFYFKNTKYLLCVLRDIRERTKYEEKITWISTQLTHLINNIKDVYAIYDLKTQQYDFVSDNVETIYGCSKQLYMNEKSFWKSCIHPDDAKGVEKEVNQIITDASRGEIFYRIKTASGERKTLLEKLVVGTDQDGRADKLYIVKTDYTNIENAEQSLMETERKFRFISENLSDFISIHNTDWNFTYASPSIKNILGFEPEDVIGIVGFDLVHPEDLLKTIENCIKPIVLEKKETQFRFRMVSKNGIYKWVEMYSKPVIDSKGEISSIICSTRDVSEQVEAEHKLRESEEQYRLLSENSNDLIGIHQLTGEFIYVSPSCRQVLGYEQAELMERRPEDVFFVKKDISNNSSRAAVGEILTGKSDARFVSKVITKKGEEKLLEVWLKPVFKNEKLVAYQSASRDVTEREKLLGELELSLAKERELNELRAMFVSTASHQFRTPLTVIQSGVEIMELYLDDLPPAKQAKFQNHFKKIQEEVDRLEYLMNDVLLLGRANAARTPFHPISADLKLFCTKLITNKYNNRYAADRQVLLTASGPEVNISFDPKLLSHAIENIISNSYKYSEQGNLFLDLVFEQKRVTINITDTGIGIPEEDIKNLFQPFYRATNTYEIAGTGLGLSIVKEFVEKNGGEIFVSSKLNKGTTVSVILPID